MLEPPALHFELIKRYCPVGIPLLQSRERCATSPLDPSALTLSVTQAWIHPPGQQDPITL